MKQEKGFTLIELLAVIVILAVIALIATPLIMGVINDSKKGSAKDSAYAIIIAGELKIAREKLSTPIIFTEEDDLEYKGTKAGKMNLEFDSKGRSDLQLFIDGTCIYKDYDEKEVRTDSSKTTPDTCVTGVRSNIVVDLKSGMIPVTYDASGNTVKADTSTIWYDYNNKMWANAVSVTSGSRSEYMSASAGTPILEEDILGYFVYIPRYRYQLWNAEDESKPEQEIKIEFERRYTKKSNGNKNGEWLTHPAFTFGSSELNGIWVGKFELTGTRSNPTVKPNSYSLTNQNVSQCFQTIRLFQTNPEYGLESYNGHMIKNMEWGATAYLTNSKYGICANGSCPEVWINNTQKGTDGIKGTEAITGCSGIKTTTYFKPNMTACEEGRDYKQLGTKASTTSNIYGIYDMSGGVWERVMANSVSASGTMNMSASGFTSAPDAKYWDSYPYNENRFNFNIGQLGDATREVRRINQVNNNNQGWYNDYSQFPTTTDPWFHRGGNAGSLSNAGIYFFNGGNGYGNDPIGIGTRATLVLE